MRRTISEDLPWSTWPAVATTRSSFIYASTSWSRVRSARILLAIVTVEVVTVFLVAFERVVHGPCEMRDLRVRHRPAVQQDEPILDPRERRRRAGAQSGGEGGCIRNLDPNAPRGQAGPRHRAATDGGLATDDPRPFELPADRLGKDMRAAPDVSGASRSIRKTGISASRPVGDDREHLLECRHLDPADANGPGDRMPAQPVQQVRPPDDDAGLRPAEQLVGREGDEIGSLRRARPRRWARRPG